MGSKLDVHHSVYWAFRASKWIIPAQYSIASFWSRNLYGKLIGVSAGHAHMLALFLSIDEERTKKNAIKPDA